MRVRFPLAAHSMNPEKETDDRSQEKVSPATEKKIHKTHFPVEKIPLQDSNLDTGYEWVDLGNGRWKRVTKKYSESV